jgi:hypothetical protein
MMLHEDLLGDTSSLYVRKRNQMLQAMTSGSPFKIVHGPDYHSGPLFSPLTVLSLIHLHLRPQHYTSSWPFPFASALQTDPARLLANELQSSKRSISPRTFKWSYLLQFCSDTIPNKFPRFVDLGTTSDSGYSAALLPHVWAPQAVSSDS